jgi:nitroreductase
MLLDLITQRQSVRRWSSRPVEKDKIDRCLEAARLAPSACNSQPWHFIVINDPALKSKLAQKIFRGPYAINTHAEPAPVWIAVVSDKAPFMTRFGGLLRGTPFYLLDIGASIMQFLLAAAEQNLGTCWLGWFNERHAQKTLGISRNKRIFSFIALGYPADEPRPKNRKSLADISSYNHP